MKKAVLLPIFIISFLFSCTTGIPRQEVAEVYFNLGNAYFELKHFDKAVNAYLRALQLDESLARASYNLARVYIETEKLGEGIKILKQLLEKEPENSILLSALAYAYTLQGRTEEALETYGKILSRNSFDQNALYNTGVLLWRSERREEAKEYFLKLYSMTPENYKLLYNLGILELELGNNERGIDFLQEYTEKRPQDLDALTALGDAYMEEKLYYKALDAYDTVLSIDEKKPKVYFKKSYILLTVIGDAEKGMEALEKSIIAGFKDKEQFLNLLSNPDLLDRKTVEMYLLEKGLITPNDLTEEDVPVEAE
ncbi:MAG: hypothetical protein DRP87_13075 [Spirochaetes bacterium]|nr:MAG: hypothetical protein DRP87_13075 [Spirochaetota bacterium]